MSYWTFTDIFEEAGPRSTPFHGGFGLINYQDIKKPAFRAYEYLNKLGPTQLRCDDAHSLVAREAKGDVQALFWDYTNSIPGHVNNQQYFASDIKPKPKGAVRLQITGLKPGTYHLAIYRVGYRINDPYADYLALGRPSQLTRAQVARIKKRNDGKPVATETAVIRKGEKLVREYPMRDNDVYLVTFSR
jgi:xylan 1,4-beta-xylosidase